MNGVLRAWPTIKRVVGFIGKVVATLIMVTVTATTIVVSIVLHLPVFLAIARVLVALLALSLSMYLTWIHRGKRAWYFAGALFALDFGMIVWSDGQSLAIDAQQGAGAAARAAYVRLAPSSHIRGWVGVVADMLTVPNEAYPNLQTLGRHIALWYPFIFKANGTPDSVTCGTFVPLARVEIDARSVSEIANGADSLLIVCDEQHGDHAAAAADLLALQYNESVSAHTRIFTMIYAEEAFTAYHDPQAARYLVITALKDPRERQIITTNRRYQRLLRSLGLPLPHRA